MKYLESLKLILDVFVAVVALISIPVAIYQYEKAVRKEQHDREYGTYNALDEKYVEYQQLCLAHPALDIFDVPLGKEASLSEDQWRQELIAFTILMSIFERAFLMYSDQGNEIKRRQWEGWQEFMRGFCEREKFRNAWQISGTTFDKKFEEFMNSLIKSIRTSA